MVVATLLDRPFDFKLWKSKGFGVGAWGHKDEYWYSNIDGFIDIEMVPLFPDYSSRRKNRRLAKKSRAIDTTKWRPIGAERHGHCLRVYVHRLDDFGAYTKLPQAIVASVHWDSLTHLFLPNSTITRLPSFIRKLDHLQAIDLNGSKIKQLPNWIGQMMNLKHLNLDRTDVKSLPDSIEGLQSLETLRLCNTKVSHLPDSIGNLSNLRKLILYHTSIGMLPNSIGNLVNLEILHLNITQISEIPASLGNLKNLLELDLNFTSIKSIPETIGNLVSLRKLELENAPLKSIPFSVGGLNLIRLNLTDTQIRTLPDEISGLVSLERLLLHGSKIRSLPRSIGGLKNLEYLGLSETSNLLELPEEIGDLASLNELDLQDSSITSLPESIKRLRRPWIISIVGADVFEDANDPESIGSFLLDLVKGSPSLMDIADVKQGWFDESIDDELFWGIPVQWMEFVAEGYDGYFGGHCCIECYVADFRMVFHDVYYHLGCNRARLRPSIQMPTLWPLALQNAQKAFEREVGDIPISANATACFPQDAIYQLIRTQNSFFYEMCIHRNARRNASSHQNQEY